MSKTQWADKLDIPDVQPQPGPATNGAAQGEQKPKQPPPKVVPIGALDTPPAHDPNELLKYRYLCRGGGMLVVGPTGVGKSSLGMQAALCWAIGREFFGIAPARPLRSLLIQSENDDGDLAEMRDGVLKGLAFTEEERAAACTNLLVATEDVRTSKEFCDEVLAPLLEAHKPDLIWIDPALAYLGGETNSQKDVGAFLRNGLNPLVHQHHCGVVVLHHTNKPPSGAEKPKWQGSDFAYLGSGSAEWANWPRAVLAVRSTGSHAIFELQAGKRGSRLRWVGADDERVFSRLIGHAKDGGLYWREVSQAELEAEQDAPADGRMRRYKPSLDEFLLLFSSSFRDEPREALLSAGQIKNAFHERGWHHDFYHGLADEAEAAGRIMSARGEGRGGQVLRGLPIVVEAYETRRKERGSMMEDVPLKAPSSRRKKRKKPNSSKSS